MREFLKTDKNDPKSITLKDELNNLGIKITSPELDALLLDKKKIKNKIIK
jgi:hypothetical protein